MWKEILDELKETYPKAVKLNKSVTENQILRTERILNLDISRFAPDWLNFLSYTNGASILDYCFFGAMTTRIASIDHVNQEIWQFNQWAKENFVSFMGDSSGIAIGFVLHEHQTMCIGYLVEQFDTMVLPIASSFSAFMDSFMKDVEITLRTWKAQPGKEIPYSIMTQEIWPWNLELLIERDPKLKTMLESGLLDEFYKQNNEFAVIVNKSIRR